MLTAITDFQERRNAMAALTSRLQDENACDHHARRVQRGGVEHLDVYWHRQAQVWSAIRRPTVNMNRWWCAYGLSIEQERNGLKISVEINPTAAESFDLRCAGMFARTLDNNATFLCHNGNINGATMEVFKSHYRGDWTDVYIPGPRPRYVEAAIIGSLDGQALLHCIAQFAREVDRIRYLHDGNPPPNLHNGALPLPMPFNFAPEFEGRRRRYSLDVTIAPQAKHGLVVNKLAGKIVSKGYEPQNDRQRDLFVRHNCRSSILLFEVKTDVSTSSIYQAVGQLMFNGKAQEAPCSMVLVTPEGLDEQTLRVLDRLNIQVLIYSWRAHQPRFTNLGDILNGWA